MVTGIQNAEGSTLMTIADMSVVTAEVKVDETDIVNIKLNQPVGRHRGRPSGPNLQSPCHRSPATRALLRTTGIATSQSTTGTEEAKDFKVIATIDATDPNLDELRPGLSATAKITTAHKPDALTIPIQALVQRDPAAEKTLLDNHGKPAAGAAANSIEDQNPSPVRVSTLFQKMPRGS